MLTLPSQLLTEIFKTGNTPRVGIKIDTMTQYFSAHQKFTTAGTGGQTFTSEITNAPRLNISINHLGGMSKIGNMSVSILNQEMFSDVFADGGSYSDPEGIEMSAKLYYYDGTDIQENEGIEFFRGIISDFPSINQSSVKLDIEANLKTMENPVCQLVQDALYTSADVSSINTPIPFVVGDMFFQRYSNQPGIWNKKDTYAFVPMIRLNATTSIISCHKLAHIDRIWVWDSGRSRLMYVDPDTYSITNPDAHGNVTVTFVNLNLAEPKPQHRYIDIIDEILSVTHHSDTSGQTNTASSFSGFSQAIQSSSGAVPGDYVRLTAGIDDTVTSIPVDDGSVFTALDQLLFYGSGTQPYEEMQVVSINGNTLTVDRGDGGTTARAHVNDIQIFYHRLNHAQPLQEFWWDYESDGANLGRTSFNNLKDYDSNTYIQHTLFEDYSGSFNIGYDWPNGGGTDTQLKVEFAEVSAPQEDLANEDTGNRAVKGLFYKDNLTSAKLGVFCHGGRVTGTSIQERGSSYLSKPTVKVDTPEDGFGVGAEVSVTDLRVKEILKTDEGSGTGYTSAPTVTVTGNATATCTVSGGSVVSITVTNDGSGYSSTATVSFSGGGGSGAEATASMEINTMSVDDNGWGYATAPKLSFDGGGGFGAEVNTTLSAFDWDNNNVNVGNNKRLENSPVVLDFPLAKGNNHTVYLSHHLNSSITSDQYAKCAGLWWEIPYIVDADVTKYQMFASCLGMEYGTWVNDDETKITFLTQASTGDANGHGVNTFVGVNGPTFANGDIGKWFKVNTNPNQFGIIRLVDTGTNTITLDRDWSPAIGNQVQGYMEDSTYTKHIDFRKEEDSTGVLFSSVTFSNDNTQGTITLDGGHRWAVGDWVKLDGNLSAPTSLEFPYVTKIISIPAYNKIKINGYWTNLSNETLVRLPVITNPAGVIEGMLRQNTEMVTSDFHSSTMNITSGQLSDAVLGFTVQNESTMLDLLDDLGQKVKTSLSFNHQNQLKLNTFISSDPFPNSGTNTPGTHDTFKFTTVLNASVFTAHPIAQESFQIVKTGKLLTRVTIPYGKDYLNNSYNYQTIGTNNSVHNEVIEEVIEHPFTYDEATAELFRDYLLARRHKKFWELSLTTFTNAVMFETFDYINVRHPVLTNLFSGYESKKWLITDMKQDYDKFQIKITAREV